MISLDEALYRLLYKRRDREAFFVKGPEALPLSPDDREALASIDRDQLKKTAERIVSDLATRQHRGSGDLSELFPRTIAAFSETQNGRGKEGERPARTLPSRSALHELMLCFLESAAFDAYRELPFGGLGLSLEEAFFQFAEAEGIGEAAVREQEMLGAVLRALAVSPDAAFLLPEAVRRVPRGFFAVTSSPAAAKAPMLYAAVDQKLLVGPLTPFLADLLRAEEPAARIAERHGIPQSVLEASRTRLVEMHLLPP